MTQFQLNRAVAASTGESIGTINRYGFSVLHESPETARSDKLRFLVDCPFCGRPADYPGLARDGSAALAECERCDVYFDFPPHEIYCSTGP